MRDALSIDDVLKARIISWPFGLYDCAAQSDGAAAAIVVSERKAREVALYRQGKFRDVRLASAAKKAEDVFSQMAEQAGANIQLIVKADVQGSAEALRDALSKLGTDEVGVKVIASGVGGITTTVLLTASSRTSVLLLELLCRHRWRVTPRFATARAEATDLEALAGLPHDAVLVIGDAALLLSARAEDLDRALALGLVQLAP